MNFTSECKTYKMVLLNLNEAIIGLVWFLNKIVWFDSESQKNMFGLVPV